MITVYEVKPNGFLGRTKQINPSEGVGSGWVYDEPSAPICKWENATWVVYEKEPLDISLNYNPDAIAEEHRNKRDKLLAASDFTQLPDVPLSDELKQKWTVYRQELRDITNQEGFPLTCVFPDQPA